MSNFYFSKYISFIINSILIILIYIFFLNSYFSPIIEHIKEKGFKANIFKYIADMYDNLTIYKEIYLKNEEDFRYFKNGDIYYGKFNKGNYNGIGIYYKKGIELPFHIYSFFVKLNTQIPRIIDKSYLIYYGDFENGIFNSGFYVDIDHQIIYSGEWKDNEANGKGMIYFYENCTINGIFLQNSLINRTNCSCQKSFCDLFYYFKINTQKFETNQNIDWEKTIKSDSINKKLSFNRNIIIPLIWIFYIIFKEKVLNFIYHFIHDKFVYKKIIKRPKSDFYKNKIIINEAKVIDKEGTSVEEDEKYNFKCKNSVLRLIYQKNNKQGVKGTCFICKIILNTINLETICLFTNYHVLTNIEDKIKNSSIKITLGNDFKKNTYIEINENTNLIFCKALDYIFIEMKKNMIKEDKMKEEKEKKSSIEININKENGIKTFFEIDDNIYKQLLDEEKNKKVKKDKKDTNNKNNEYLGTEARLSGFPLGGEKIIKEEGKITEVDKKYNFKFYHNLNTEKGNSGSPICNKINSKLIGIHCAYDNTNENIKNIGTFFRDILKDIRKKYIYNTIQNQPIFGGKIGYFCELKSLNFCFLLIEYGIYEQFILNKDILTYETILNEKKIIDLKLKRFIFPSKNKKMQQLSKDKNFAIVEILQDDSINYFFHFKKIDEEIISKGNEKYNEYIENIKIEKIKIEEILVNEKAKMISKYDLFDAIENSGSNINGKFQSFEYYIKENKKMRSCYFKIQEKLDIFINQIILNIFKYIDTKKYFPKYNYLKILIRIIIFIFLILVHLIGFFKYDYSNKKKEIKKYSLNLFYTKKANFEIKNNSILLIKKGIFNKIDLDYSKRKKIKSILIEKGSKIEGNCSFLFSHFINCQNIQIENLDTSDVIDMGNIFFSNKNLEYLDLKNFDTSNTKNMNGMFYKCEKIKELDLTSFKTSNTISMDNMFRECFNLEELKISSFDTKNTISMNYMFDSCFKLKQLDLSNFNTSNLEYMEFMFALAFSLKELDLSNFNTLKVKNMNAVFSFCKSLMELDLSNFNTSNVENMDKMFYGCESLKRLNLSNFNTSNINSMEEMFYNCESLKELDLSTFNTSNVKKMDKMFYDCKSLIKLNLSNFNTSNLKSMEEMFSNCESLIKLNLSNFKTSNVINMKGIFSNCISLKDLEINHFDTKNVIDMSFMFSSCNNLEKLNLSHFITINVKNMNNMFYNCSSLKILDISNFIDLCNINVDRIFDLTSPNLKKIYNNQFAIKLNKAYNNKIEFNLQKLKIDIK